MTIKVQNDKHRMVWRENKLQVAHSVVQTKSRHHSSSAPGGHIFSANRGQ